MSEAHSGEKNHFYGKHHSEETKHKLRVVHAIRRASGIPGPRIGSRNSEEACRRISESKMGIPLSDSHRMSISDGINSFFNSEDGDRERLSRSVRALGEKNPFYGRKHSEETREKIRIARAKQTANLKSKSTYVVDGVSGATDGE